MATSITEICNLALGRLGDVFLTSLDDNSRQARACNRFYDATRRQLLSAHPWTFATTRVGPLSPTTTSPAFGFDLQFSIPSDCIKVQGLFECDQPYVIEGKTILTDATTINVVYTADVTDPATFSDMFTSCFVLRLAYTIGYCIAPSSDLSKMLYQLYGTEFAEARRVDNSERDWKLRPPLTTYRPGEKRTWREVRN